MCPRDVPCEPKEIPSRYGKSVPKKIERSEKGAQVYNGSAVPIVTKGERFEILDYLPPDTRLNDIVNT